MRRAALALPALLPLLLGGCVLDRTGKSAPEAMRLEMADHARRVAELEAVSEDLSARLAQLEEVTRARGQEEILKMETMEQLRQEVARLRGDLELLQHDYTTYEAAGIGFQEDSDYRMAYAEQRVAALEKTLGLKPPAPPARGGAVAETPPTPDAGGGTTPPPEVAPTAPSTPEEIFALITNHLQAGNGAAARAVANKFIAENPKGDRVAEAYYRIAESYQNESDWQSAAAAFQVVVDRYPDSSWAPWSLLRQGECFEALGKKDAARLFWQGVIDKYPKSKAAKEAKARLGR